MSLWKTDRECWICTNRDAKWLHLGGFLCTTCYIWSRTKEALRLGLWSW